MPADKPVPKIISPEEGLPVRPFGLDMKIMLGTEETGGAMSAIFCVHGPGEGPPGHMHDHQDEYFLVLEGQYEVVVDGGVPQIVGPGAMMYVPRGHVHGFKNIGATPAKMVDWSIPGGQDRYFREVSDAQAGGSFSGGSLDEINRKHTTRYFR